MGFSLAGFVGGAATQGLKDIEEEETRVKTFYAKELDRSVAEQREMRKDRRKKVDSRMEQITMLESFFGGDPQARNMAAKVVAGGSANVQMILGTLQKARANGATQADMYKAVQFIPDKDAPGQSFETARDAAESITQIIKPADLSGLSSAASKQSKGLFSMAVNKDKIFNSMVQEYKNLGEFKNEDSGKIVQAMKGTLKVDFSQLPTEVKSLDTQYAQVNSKLNRLDKTSPTYEADKTKLTSELTSVESAITKLAIAKEGTPTDTSTSISVLSSLLTKKQSAAEASVGWDDAKGGSAIDLNAPDKPTVFGADALKIRNDAVKKSKMDYLQTLLGPDGKTPISTKAEMVIAGFLKDEYKELLGQGKDGSKPTTIEEKNAKLKETYPDPTSFITNSLKTEGARKNPNLVVDNLMAIYGIDFTAASALMDKAFKNIKPLAKKQVYTAPSTTVKERTDPGWYTTDAEQEKMDAWDKQYGDTHNHDGTLKSTEQKKTTSNVVASNSGGTGRSV